MTILDQDTRGGEAISTEENNMSCSSARKWINKHEFIEGLFYINVLLDSVVQKHSLGYYLLFMDIMHEIPTYSFIADNDESWPFQESASL